MSYAGSFKKKKKNKKRMITCELNRMDCTEFISIFLPQAISSSTQLIQVHSLTRGKTVHITAIDF